jgi:branched-chain amino acid transport system permease protein
VSLISQARPVSPAVVVTDAVAPLVGVVVLTLLMHFVLGPAAGPYYAKILVDIAIAIILAVSLNVVNGFTGQFSIGHAAFMAVGGYTAAAVTYFGSVKLWGGLPLVHADAQGYGLFFVGTVAGACVAGLFGVLVGLPSLRLRGDYLALVTLGFGEIIRVLLMQTGSLPDPTTIAAAPLYTLPLKLGGSLGFGGVPTYTNLLWAWMWAGITLVIAYRLKFSTHGRAFLSVREDEIAAEAMGIPTTAVKVRAFVLSAALAGVAGALFAHELGTTLNPKELGFQKSFEVVIMVVLGGMGSLSGAVLAAAVLTVLPEVLREFSEYRMIVYSLILILVMLVRPQGLFGIHEIWELPIIRRLLGRK